MATYASEAYAPLSAEADCLGEGDDDEDLDREGRWVLGGCSGASVGCWGQWAGAAGLGGLEAWGLEVPCTLLPPQHLI